MPLIPQVKVLQTGSASIQVTDNTGLYDSVANPGGWGVPNLAKSAVQGILSSLTPINQAETAIGRLSSQNQANYLYQGGITIMPTLGMTFKDGVYIISIRLGFLGSALLTAVAGSYQFALAGSDAIFAAADGFTIDSINNSVYFQIDRTKPLTSSGGYVTTPLPLVGGAFPTTYLQCTINALISQAGFNCLNQDIANFAGTCQCCDGEEVNALLCRYAEYLSMNNKFILYGDFAGADALAKKLQKDCTPANGFCTPMGTQQNVPFTGNAPVITLQPVNQSIVVGAEVAFSVVATGTQPLYYQWYKNGIPIPGAVASNYTILNAQLSDSATFHVVVTNAYGAVTSNEVSLTVGSGLQPVVITVQPTNQSGSLAGSATFSVTATGSATIAYQWYKAGVAIGGATNSSLVLNNIQLSDVASYYCVVSNQVNSISSATVTLSLGVQVGWGWSAAAPVLQSDLNAAQGSGTIATGAELVADFRANSAPLILWAFEPLTEPAKIKWFGDVNNNGHIGDPNNDLFITKTIGTSRVYYTVFATAQTNTTIQFLTS